MKTKPQVFKAIGTALLGALTFALTYLLVGLLISILNAIPVISTVLGWLFKVRGDSPSLMLLVLSPTIGYITTVSLLSAINKNTSTLGISLIIVGSLLVAVHLISMVINLVYGNTVLANISQTIAGIAFIAKGSENMSKK